MSTTDTDTTGEDRLLRLLDDEGARWRAGYQPPSFDDAVRRLALPGADAARPDHRDEAPVPARARRTSRWWRPVLVAGCVVLLVGAVVAHLGRAPLRSGPSRTATSSAPQQAARSVLPELTGLPVGFVATQEPTRTGPAIVPPAPPTLVDGGFWVRRQASDPDGVETLALELGTGRAPAAEGVEVDVRAHQASLTSQEIDCPSGRPGCRLVSLIWAEDPDHWVQLLYNDWAQGRSSVLSDVDVLEVARSFDPGLVQWPQPVLWGTQEGARGVPASLVVAGRRLVLSGTVPLSGAVVDPATSGFAVAVSRVGGAASVADHCAPYLQAFTTGLTGGRVTVGVGAYVAPGAGAAAQCPATAHPITYLWSSAGQPLGGRSIVDALTGAAVPRTPGTATSPSPS